MTTPEGEGVPAGDGLGPDAQACAWVRDRLPLRGLGMLDPRIASDVEAHVAECEGCRAEAELVASLQRSAPVAPPSILKGVRERVADRSNPRRTEWKRWAIRSAAVVALALGVGLVWGRDSGSDVVWAMALDPAPQSWYGNEWVVAGQPIPEGLSDEVLRSLLEEMDP